MSDVKFQRCESLLLQQLLEAKAIKDVEYESKNNIRGGARKYFFYFKFIDISREERKDICFGGQNEKFSALNHKFAFILLHFAAI
jgi:hypothetical protein